MENTRQTGKHMRMSKYYFGVAPKASCTLPKIETDKTLFWNLCNLSEKDELILQDITYTVLAAHHSQLIIETLSAQLKEKVSCCKICPIAITWWNLKTLSPLSPREWGHSAEKGGCSIWEETCRCQSALLHLGCCCCGFSAIGSSRQYEWEIQLLGA